MQVTITGEGLLKDLKVACQWMKGHKVRIGIPDSGGSRGQITNAQLAFILTNGSPINRLPPRPFLEPALEKPEVQEQIIRHMKQAAKAAIDNDFGEAMAQLNMAGIAGQEGVQGYMDSGPFAPNAAITIEGGWMRSRKKTLVSKKGTKYGKAFYVKGKGSSKPLIDTGDLRSAITYVIE